MDLLLKIETRIMFNRDNLGFYILEPPVAMRLVNGVILLGNRQQSVAQIEEFLESNEKCMLLTGTHQYEKHKLIMRILNKKLDRHLILFRTNSMQNIENEEFLGWAKVKRNLKAGERIKIGKNFYECDSSNTSSTWHKTNHNFSCAILYPLDSLCRSEKLNAIDDLFRDKEISKIFLVSWTDQKNYDYSIFTRYISRHVVYDAEEEDPAYHKRVLDILKQID